MLITPTDSFLLLEILMSVPILVKIDKKCFQESVHRRIHRYTDRHKLVL